MTHLLRLLNPKLLALVLVGGMSPGCIQNTTVAQAEDAQEPTNVYRWSAATDAKIYNVTIAPEAGPPPIGKMHRWVIEVYLPNGEPVYPARISVGGGMQDHGHGLPTQPQVIAYGGGGAYLIDGMRFTMEGSWRLIFFIEAGAGNDRVAFDVMLPALLLADEPQANWSEREIRLLRSMSLASLGEVPDSPGNRIADDPRAVKLGQRLFFDARLSRSGKQSCATCHQPAQYFTDGLPRSLGAGKAMRNSPTIVGAAYNQWFYWDGRRDSLWAQALIPIEAPDEMNSSRAAVLRVLATDDDYRKAYLDLFGSAVDAGLSDLPGHAGPFADSEGRSTWLSLSHELQNRVNHAYANIGKAIAAFERTLLPAATRFDRYVSNLGHVTNDAGGLSADEVAGARLFFDASRTQCLQCHNGALLTNGGFHNIGSGNFTGENLDFGRSIGLQAVLMDEFNCLGPFSDANPQQCRELLYLNKDSHLPLRGAFKVPSLRELRRSGPYFHDGRFASLAEVLDFYNEPPSPNEVGPHELKAMHLDAHELRQLELFLLTLSN